MKAANSPVRYIETMTTDEVDQFLDDCSRAVEYSNAQRGIVAKIRSILRGILTAALNLFRA